MIRGRSAVRIVFRLDIVCLRDSVCKDPNTGLRRKRNTDDLVSQQIRHVELVDLSQLIR